MKLFTQKKAFVEVQFNWIFILIVGGLLLLFFGSFIVKQKQTSDIKLSSQVVTDLEAVLTGAGVSVGAAELIEIPDLPIKITCNNFGIKDIEKPVSKATPIFAPDLIKGNFLVTWTKDWNVPFRITNFLYVTSPQLRYILVGSGTFPETVLENLPPKTIIHDEEPKLTMNKELVDIDDIENIRNLNNYKVKFIFFGDHDLSTEEIPAELVSMKDGDVKAIVVKSLAIDPVDYGRVVFYNKNGEEFEEEESTIYIGEASLYGAIFAEDYETYTCVMGKAFIKMDIVSAIYLNRVDSLYATYSINSPCSDYYEDGAYFGQVKLIAAAGFSPNTGILYNIGENIRIRNQNIIRASCEAIY